jgi:branched-chain amino acid transport system substrate-binding protein
MPDAHAIARVGKLCCKNGRFERATREGDMTDVKTLSRRTLVKIGLSAMAAPAVLRALPAEAQSQVIKIGHVSPKTGPLAGFGEADGFILEQVRGILSKGLSNNGKTYKVEIISKDSQSSGSRAAEVASELILGEKVNLIVGSATPDTTNPVSDQAEVNEVPCITTNCPWQPYFFGRKGDPNKGFTWTYHFFWGLEDVIASFLALWDDLPTNKVVGGLFPNDADGNAWGDAKLGLPPALAKAGYKLHDPGRYQLMNNDFTSQISAFKAAGAEIVTGNMIPPDFATFWSQAAQQGFRPKIVTIGKALLFPSVIESLGARGNGLTSEIWWTPNHPFKSGLTGQSCRELTDAYTKAANRPWTQPIGFQHALFEVAIDVLKRAKNLSDPKSILASIVATNYQSIVGPIQWTGAPVKNVTKTPLVAGQWQRNNGKFDLVIIENKTVPNIPVGGKLQPIS